MPVLAMQAPARQMRRCFHCCSERHGRVAAASYRAAITPESIRKNIFEVMTSIAEADYVTVAVEEEPALSAVEIRQKIKELRERMLKHAEKMEFEEAAALRDEILELEQQELMYG